VEKVHNLCHVVSGHVKMVTSIAIMTLDYVMFITVVNTNKKLNDTFKKFPDFQ